MNYSQPYEPITWQDEVKDAQGNILQEGTNADEVNLNRMEAGIDVSTTDLALIAHEALQKAYTASKELEKWQKQRVQQGIVTIYNKFVLTGAIISKMANSRYIQISSNGTYDLYGVSRIFADGKPNYVKDEQAVAVIPTNTTSASKTYYAYLIWDTVTNKYKVYVDVTTPINALKLYRIIVPSNDTASNLDSCNFYDERRVESGYPHIYNAQPFATVSIPGFPMIDLDYDVNVSLENADDIGSVGELNAYDKQLNGFKIKFTGNTDNVKVRWTILNPDIK